MPLICFASPKGGVGKTFLSANVAGVLARSARRVIAVDLDPQNALRLHFGVRLEDGSGLTRLLADRPDWHRLIRGTDSGVDLLAHGEMDSPGALALALAVHQNPHLLTGPLRQMLADPETAVVVDLPPGPSSHVLALLPMTDLLVSVLHATAGSIALLPAIESGATYGDMPSGAVNQADIRGRLVFAVNQFDPRTRLGPSLLRMLEDHLGPRLLGTVYRDEAAAEALAQQRLLAEYAPASKAALDVAALAGAIAARVARQSSAQRHRA